MKRIIMILMLVQALYAGAQEGIFAVFQTSEGSFTCALDYVRAPQPVANFIGLAEGSQSWLNYQTGEDMHQTPFFNGSIFHRTVKNVASGITNLTAIQGGGQAVPGGYTGPGYSFPDTFHPALRHTNGAISMANSGPNSNGSQFFIMAGTNHYTAWDDHYTVFGCVVAGMQVVTNIGMIPSTTNERPDRTVTIHSVTIQRVGAAAEAFATTNQGLPVVAGTEVSPQIKSNTCSLAFTAQQYGDYRMFTSSNLLSWSDATVGFHSGTSQPLAIEAESAGSSNAMKFFNLAQVQYEAPIYTPDSVEHTRFQMVFDSGTDYKMWLYPGATGTWIVTPLAGAAITGSFSHWTWAQQPYSGTLVSYDNTTYSPKIYQCAFSTPGTNSFTRKIYWYGIQVGTDYGKFTVSNFVAGRR